MKAILYRFIIGTESHSFTTAQQPVEHQGAVYEPAYIRDGGVHQGQEPARATLQVTMARDNPVAALFIGGPPAQVVELERWRRVDETTQLTWLGRVLTVARAGSEATADCLPILVSMQRTGLRRRYQYACPHALYDSGCTVNPQNFRVDATITARTASTITAAPFASKPDGWFTGGWLELTATGAKRAIVSHAGDTVTLGSVLRESDVGDTVHAFAGCDHTIATCQSKFANDENYGGFTTIPRKNPFGLNPIF